LSFESDSGTNTRTGWTDENGNVSGKVPSNEVITMKIAMYNSCDPLTVSTIGPFTADTNLGNQTAPTINQYLSTINGSLATCSGGQVTDGYVYLSSNIGSSFATVTDGNFSVSILSCDPPEEFDLVGIDYENLHTTDTIHYTATPPVTEMGTIPVCNTITQFISYTLDDNPTEYLISNIQAYWIASEEFFNISAQNNNEHSMYFSGSTMTLGNYTTNNNFTVYIDGQSYWINADTPNSVIFHLNSFGAFGEYIDITFSGSFTATDGVHDISATVHVKRQ